MLFHGDRLFCANSGDSRAIAVATSTGSKELHVTALSRDHKPSEKDEADRVIKAGGRIESFQGTKLWISI